jgi:hypothetical protein
MEIFSLRSLNEREEVNNELAVRATEGAETAFRTEEDGLFFTGEDGAEAGRKQSEQSYSRLYKNHTIFPTITLAFAACCETKARL